MNLKLEDAKTIFFDLKNDGFLVFFDFLYFIFTLIYRASSSFDCLDQDISFIYHSISFSYSFEQEVWDCHRVEGQ